MFLAMPVMRTVARIEFPSTNAEITRTRSDCDIRFMLTIMLERLCFVKHYLVTLHVTSNQSFTSSFPILMLLIAESVPLRCRTRSLPASVARSVNSPRRSVCCVDPLSWRGLGTVLRGGRLRFVRCETMIMTPFQSDDCF